MAAEVIDLSAGEALFKHRTNQRRRGAGPPQSGDRETLPTIKVLPGELPRVIDEAEAALLQYPEHGIYRFGSKLVQIVWDRVRVSGGGNDEVLRHSVINSAAMLEHFSAAAKFEHWSKTAEDFVPCDCPKQVAESYVARDGRWKVPPLLGVVTAPTLRPDGSLITTPGYDEVTGLVFDPLGVDFGNIPLNPTREQALRALRPLKRLLHYFKFVSPKDRSVAISGILTALARKSMPVAPLHGFDAPVAGSGKSYLVNVAAMIATGHRAPVMATGGDRMGESELEKRLAASVLGGDTIISMDNVDEELDSQLLCQLLTEHIVTIRNFGRLQNIVVPSSAAYFANGNNLTVVGDLTRRSLIARIDPQVERPELSLFPFHPIDMAKKHRPLLVRSVLTIILGRIKSGYKSSLPPLGSYAEWSYLVRDSLTWLGEPDPAEVMERAREFDPRLGRLRSVMMAWYALFGVEEKRTRDVVAAANATYSPGEYGEPGDYRHSDFRDAIYPISANNGVISPDKLGWWIKRNLERSVTIEAGTFRFEKTVETTQGARWQLVLVNPRPDYDAPT